MRVLVACERFGVVRDAFRALGHDAWSCDITAATGHHLHGDVFSFIEQPWDLMIAHPPCTDLAVSGALRFKGKEQKQEDALLFVNLLMAAPIPRICIENPVSIISTRIRKPDQIIQPYQFGHDASKKTCLWLKGLPKLVIDPAQYVLPRWACQNRCGWISEKGWIGGPCPGCGKKLLPRWANQTDSGQNRLAPSEHRAMDRARTYEGIAAAMAEQWSIA